MTRTVTVRAALAFAALVALVALVPWAAARADGPRVALVVGNAAYETVPALANPGPDARAVARELDAMGFDAVRLVEDGTRLELEAALDELADRATDAATAVFYFAGHGIQVDGRNYLVPVDATLTRRRDVDRLVGLDEVMREVSQATGLGLVVLDACRDNPFGARLAERVGRGSMRRGLGPVGSRGRGNTLVAYATEADAVALDGEGGHSPYTRALVTHLATPGLDVRLMLGAVRDDVVRATGGEQVPHVYGSLGGATVALVPGEPPSASMIATAPAPAPAAAAPRPPAGHGFLTVEAVPADARVRITNIAPAYAPGMALPLGRDYDVMVSRAGYRAQRFGLALDEADERVAVTLEPLDARADGATPAPSPAATGGGAADADTVTVDGVAAVAGERGAKALDDARRAALADALETAVLRVAGAIVGGGAAADRSVAGPSRGGPELERRLGRDPVFRQDIAARSTAFAALDAIRSEGADGDLYRVRASVRVESDALREGLSAAGLHADAGRPGIHLSVRREVNGNDLGPSAADASMLRGAFARSGIRIAAVDDGEAAFRIPITIAFTTERSARFGLWSADCSARYEILDTSTDTSVAAHREEAGPEGGVSETEVSDACASSLVPALAEHLVANVRTEMDGIVDAGTRYRLAIADVPGARVGELTEAINLIFRVTSVSGVRFDAGTLELDLRYVGSPLDFVESLTRSLDGSDARVELRGVRANDIALALR